MLFYVWFVCKCVLPPGDNPIAVNKYIISPSATLPLQKCLVPIERVAGRAPGSGWRYWRRIKSLDLARNLTTSNIFPNVFTSQADIYTYTYVLHFSMTVIHPACGAPLSTHTAQCCIVPLLLPYTTITFQTADISGFMAL